jgi:hypothetical protein
MMFSSSNYANLVEVAEAAVGGTTLATLNQL